MVITDTFTSDANKPIFAETAFLAATLAVGLMGITHLIAVPAALFIYLVLVTLFLALPIRNTLATDAYKALFAEATLLAGLGAMLIFRVACFLACSTTLFEHFIIITLFFIVVIVVIVILLTALGGIWTLVNLHTEPSQWVSSVASLTIAPTWTRQRLDIAGLANVITSPLAVRGFSTVQPFLVDTAFVHWFIWQKLKNGISESCGIVGYISSGEVIVA